MSKRSRALVAVVLAIAIAAGVLVAAGALGSSGPVDGRVARAQGQARVQIWETTGHGGKRVARAPGTRFRSGSPPRRQVISVDEAKPRQEIMGFGATLTDSAAYELDKRARDGRPEWPDRPSPRAIAALFGAAGAAIDLVRIPIGGNDFSQARYTPACADDNARCSARNNYTEHDPAPGARGLAGYRLTADTQYLIPTLKAALAINPRLSIIASPWTAPAWMKCQPAVALASGDRAVLRQVANRAYLRCAHAARVGGGSSPATGVMDGGVLIERDVPAYAQYLADFVEAYTRAGIRIAAMSVQNEPLTSSGSYPSMVLTPRQEQAVAVDLHRDLAAFGLPTAILALDHNWADAAYLHSRPPPAPFAGVAFHCYGGDPSVENEFRAPGAQIYETECSTQGAYASPPHDLHTSSSDFADDLVYNALQELVETIQHGSSSGMFYNLVANADYGPTINPGCYGTPNDNCLPIEAAGITGKLVPQVGYYLLRQLDAFVQPGAHAISSTLGAGGSCPPPPGDPATNEPRSCLWSVAFQNPGDGSIVLFVLNSDPKRAERFSVRWHRSFFSASIPASSVQTYVW